MPSPQAVEAALRITPLFYDAALDPERWPSVLEQLCEAFGAQAANVNLGRPSDATILSSHFFGVTRDLAERYLAFGDYAAGDPRYAPGLRRPNRPFHRGELAGDEAWYASRIYREIFEPFGLDHNLTVHVLDEGRDIGVAIGFFRGAGRAPFTDADTERLQLYVPHVRQATRVALRVLDQQATSAALAAAFDEIELATLIVDRFAEVQFANAAARALLAEGSELCRIGRKLAAADRDSSGSLRRAIFDVAVAPLSGGAQSRVQIAIPRHDGRPGLQATVAPLAQTEAVHLSQVAWAAVFLTDPLKSYETPNEQLQRLFGLTEAEADVMGRFVGGAEVKAIARETGRSYETVRWHMKQVMGKVGVSRQADLVRIAAAVSPPLRLPAGG